MTTWVPPVQDGIGLGPRVPLLVISPWAKPGYISSQQGEFASFDKFIEEVFGLPSLGQRDSLSSTSDLMDYFNFSQKPDPKLIEAKLPYDKVLSVPNTGSAAVGGSKAGTISPPTGGPNTKFTYAVLYHNSAAPTTANVVINGSDTIPMTFKKKVGSADEYTATTTLTPGPQTYQFQFTSGSNSYQLPLNSVPFSGPQVLPFDITGFKVTPGTGAQQLGQPVEFSLTYKSPAGLTPTVAEIDIDNNLHTMNAVSGTAKTGIHYQYTTPDLGQGTHYFELKFNDGSGLQTIEEYSVAITPIYLQNSSVSPTSGTTSTNFTFSTTYTGPDAATEVDVVVDGTSYPMTLQSGNPTTGAVYQTTLSLSSGKHNFAFYATDGTNEWSAPMTPGTYTGLTVSSKGQAVAKTKIRAPAPDTNPYAFDPS
jgi:hypothetical protein